MIVFTGTPDDPAKDPMLVGFGLLPDEWKAMRSGRAYAVPGNFLGIEGSDFLLYSCKDAAAVKARGEWIGNALTVGQDIDKLYGFCLNEHLYLTVVEAKGFVIYLVCLDGSLLRSIRDDEVANFRARRPAGEIELESAPAIHPKAAGNAEVARVGLAPGSIDVRIFYAADANAAQATMFAEASRHGDPPWAALHLQTREFGDWLPNWPPKP